ncbi:unnamed protein product [Brachionus calyciflorus]|uniref:Uncharacterized protein n=1 Tax=Brachionus calyciflorus TaxID=104777 RepID=A0A813YW14_9BILA|nr:unnamed protein product [Brachionus calyciflorus]
MAKEALLLCNGSSKAYVDTMASEGAKNLPSEDGVRRMIHQYMNQDMVSTCLITNLLHSPDSFEESAQDAIKNKCLRGYIQRQAIRHNNDSDLSEKDESFSSNEEDPKSAIGKWGKLKQSKRTRKKNIGFYNKPNSLDIIKFAKQTANVKIDRADAETVFTVVKLDPINNFDESDLSDIKD